MPEYLRSASCEMMFSCARSSERRELLDAAATSRNVRGKSIEEARRILGSPDHGNSVWDIGPVAPAFAMPAHRLLLDKGSSWFGPSCDDGVESRFAASTDATGRRRCRCRHGCSSSPSARPSSSRCSCGAGTVASSAALAPSEPGFRPRVAAASGLAAAADGVPRSSNAQGERPRTSRCAGGRNPGGQGLPGRPMDAKSHSPALYAACFHASRGGAELEENGACKAIGVVPMQSKHHPLS